MCSPHSIETSKGDDLLELKLSVPDSLRVSDTLPNLLVLVFNSPKIACLLKLRSLWR